MSSSSDVGAVVGAVQWGEEGSYLREVAARGPRPQLAKVIKGQYLGVGVASLASPGLASTVLLLPAGRGVRVAAQCVKFKEGRRVVPAGPRLAIPETYDGYFEILSEDGRAVRCMESVAELARRFPDSALVRENMKAYVSRSDDTDTITEKARQVAAGETLVVVGEVVMGKGGGAGGKAAGGSSGGNGGGGARFLRCFDQAGQNVYLPWEARGKFSAIAKEDNISGVHSIRNLLNKRLPLMVRVVHGRPPVGAKAAAQFLPELRLFASSTEEPLAALPLTKDAPLLLLPPSAPLKVAHARNADQLEKTKEFTRLCERAATLLGEVADRMHVYDASVGTKGGGGGGGGPRDPRFVQWPEPGGKVRHKAHHHHHHHHHPRQNPRRTRSPPVAQPPGAPPDDYDEIDQIYDYVRGFAPLPKHIKSPYASDDPAPAASTPARRVSSTTAPGAADKGDARPTPPPIETIPSRRGEPRASEKLCPSVHPALISAALDRAAHRRVEKRTRRPEDRKGSGTAPTTPTTPQAPPTPHSPSQAPPLSPAAPAPDVLPPQERPAAPANTPGGTPNNNNSSNNNASNNNANNNNNKLFVKASQQRPHKTRVFRHKSASPVKEALLEGPPGLAAGLAACNGGGSNGGGGVPSSSSPSPLFRLRYKSLTSLALDFDTLDSSTSGGKASADSGGSGAITAKLPEKRSRRLVRPKSLTNLAWEGRHDPLGLSGTSRALLEAERKLRLEPGVYRHARDTPGMLAATSRLLQGHKKIGTLYL
ncbi:uncharacterized protein LOC126987185 [Eriocheir sinensis]|uniref:uncharacterized protein LOC126987185 n=1 Tax=Eriocheir sinensis TaxID=95602 RepID=UPI0021C6951B|nr:uncharacterized protein LOC126987185 [Eriocheir sinensis]